MDANTLTVWPSHLLDVQPTTIPTLRADVVIDVGSDLDIARAVVDVDGPTVGEAVGVGCAGVEHVVATDVRGGAAVVAVQVQQPCVRSECER